MVSCPRGVRLACSLGLTGRPQKATQPMYYLLGVEIGCNWGGQFQSAFYLSIHSGQCGLSYTSVYRARWTWMAALTRLAVPGSLC